MKDSNKFHCCISVSFISFGVIWGSHVFAVNLLVRQSPFSALCEGQGLQPEERRPAFGQDVAAIKVSEFVPIIFHVGWQVFQILVSTESSAGSVEGQFQAAVRCSAWQMDGEPFLKKVSLTRIAVFVYLQEVSRNNFHYVFHEKVQNDFSRKFDGKVRQTKRKHLLKEIRLGNLSAAVYKSRLSIRFLYQEGMGNYRFNLELIFLVITVICSGMTEPVCSGEEDLSLRPHCVGF